MDIETLWAEDAARLGKDDLKFFQPSGNTQIHTFVETADFSRDRQIGPRLLIAPKGFGKSLLLSFKSAYLRESTHSKDTIFHPPLNRGGLINSLTSISGSMHRPHLLERRDSTDAWASIWQIAILGFAAWLVDMKVSEELQYKHVFRDIDGLGTAVDNDCPFQWFLGKVVEALPQDRDEGNEKLGKILYEAESVWCIRIKAALKERSRKRIVIFLDNPDELLASNDAAALWSNVQQGLVIAVWKLDKGGYLRDHLFVFGSVRLEACEVEPHPLLRQARDITLALTYSKDELREVISVRIRLTDDSKLVTPSMKDSDPILSLIGFNSYQHPDKRGPTGTLLKEDIFEAILRHTLMSPRDLVSIGAAIIKKPKSERTPSTVRDIVNSVAGGKIFGYWKNNVFPRWSEQYDSYISRITSVVLTTAEVTAIDDSFLEKNKGGITPPMAFLWDHGLLGTAEHLPSIHKGYYLQKFRHNWSSERFHKHSALPKSQWYFVHPVLREWLKGSGQNVDSLSHPNVVIGPDRGFELEMPPIRIDADTSGQIQILYRGADLLFQTGPRKTYKFLLQCLYAWKLRGGAVRPSINDLNLIAKALDKKFGLSAEYISVNDQNASSSDLRKLAREANKLLHEIDSRNGRFMDTEKNASNKTTVLQKDLRRRGPISIHAPAGVMATISLTEIDAADIFIVESASIGNPLS